MVEYWLHSTAFSSGNDHFVFICTITGTLVNDGRSFGSLANLDLTVIYQTQETTNGLLRTRSLWLSSHSEVVAFWEQVAIQCPLDFALDCYRSQFVRVHCHLKTWILRGIESSANRQLSKKWLDKTKILCCWIFSVIIHQKQTVILNQLDLSLKYTCVYL